MPIRSDEVMVVNGRLKQVGAKFRTGVKPSRYSAVFLCECGNRIVLLVENAKKNTKSCGCFQAESLKQQQRTHGHTAGPGDSRSKTYIAWMGMLCRVRAKPGTKSHKCYGARGISVCDRWLKFEHFLQDMGICPDGLTLDRIDTNGIYCKENCRWATPTEQNRNKRDNVVVEYRGRQMSFSEACEIAGINREVARQRVLRGWDIVNALDAPVRKIRKVVNESR